LLVIFLVPCTCIYIEIDIYNRKQKWQMAIVLFNYLLHSKENKEMPSVLAGWLRTAMSDKRYIFFVNIKFRVRRWCLRTRLGRLYGLKSRWLLFTP
jgi:hypothetical protein